MPKPQGTPVSPQPHVAEYQQKQCCSHMPCTPCSATALPSYWPSSPWQTPYQPECRQQGQLRVESYSHAGLQPQLLPVQLSSLPEPSAAPRCAPVTWKQALLVSECVAVESNWTVCYHVQCNLSEFQMMVATCLTALHRTLVSLRRCMHGVSVLQHDSNLSYHTL